MKKTLFLSAILACALFNSAQAGSVSLTTGTETQTITLGDNFAQSTEFQALLSTGYISYNADNGFVTISDVANKGDKSGYNFDTFTLTTDNVALRNATDDANIIYVTSSTARAWGISLDYTSGDSPTRVLRGAWNASNANTPAIWSGDGTTFAIADGDTTTYQAQINQDGTWVEVAGATSKVYNKGGLRDSSNNMQTVVVNSNYLTSFTYTRNDIDATVTWDDASVSEYEYGTYTMIHDSRVSVTTPPANNRTYVVTGAGQLFIDCYGRTTALTLTNDIVLGSSTYVGTGHNDGAAQMGVLRFGNGTYAINLSGRITLKEDSSMYAYNTNDQGQDAKNITFNGAISGAGKTLNILGGKTYMMYGGVTLKNLSLKNTTAIAKADGTHALDISSTMTLDNSKLHILATGTTRKTTFAELAVANTSTLGAFLSNSCFHETFDIQTLSGSGTLKLESGSQDSNFTNFVLGASTFNGTLDLAVTNTVASTSKRKAALIVTSENSLQNTVVALNGNSNNNDGQTVLSLVADTSVKGITSPRGSANAYITADANSTTERTISGTGNTVRTLTLNNSTDYTTYAQIQNNINIVKTGTGKQTFTSAANLTGSITVQSGTLALTGSLGNGTVTMSDGGVLELSGTTSLGGILTSGGESASTSVIQVTSGTTTLGANGNGNFNGTFQIDAPATVNVASPNWSPIVGGNGKLVINGTLNVNDDQNDYAGVHYNNVSGNGVINYADAGQQTIVMDGYTGSIIATNGTANITSKSGTNLAAFNELTADGGNLLFSDTAAVATSITLNGNTITVESQQGSHNGSLTTSSLTVSSEGSTVNANLVVNGGTLTFAEGAVLTMGCDVTIDGSDVYVTIEGFELESYMEAVRNGNALTIIDGLEDTDAITLGSANIYVNGAKQDELGLRIVESREGIDAGSFRIVVAPEPATATLSLLALAALASRRRRH